MRGLRERDGGGIIGITQGDAAWAGVRGAMEMGSLGHGRRPADVSTGLPDQGRAAELPCRGLPRMGRDEDGDADALFQPACPGYRDNFGGGKPPSPTVPLMRHDGSMEGTKWQAPLYRTVRKGRGTKEVSDGRGGVEGENGEGLQGLWETAGECVGFQVLGTGDDGGRQRLASSGRQPVEDAEDLGAFVADTIPGGGGREGFGQIFQGGGTCLVAVWGIDVGNYPEDRAGPV